MHVEVKILSHEYEGSSRSDMSYSDFDDDVSCGNKRGLSDDEWQFEELISATHSNEENNEEEGYGKFLTFSTSKGMVLNRNLGHIFGEKQDFLDGIKT